MENGNDLKIMENGLGGMMSSSLKLQNGTKSENGTHWCFRGNKDLDTPPEISIRGVLGLLKDNINPSDPRPTIPLGHGDPSCFPCFRTAKVAEKALADALHSANFNCYAPTAGLPSASRAVAEHLSTDLPYKLTAEDVFITIGCTQAIEVALCALARPGANILLPRPGFPFYEARAAYSNLEIRFFDLLPEKGWEVDLNAIEALADENTVAMVIINPGNPCGNVFTYEHLKEVAETARKLGILVISDEVYDHLTFGSKPFVPMGVFASIVPVLTLGSISKRWIVPGWRLGWLVTNDPNGILKRTRIVDCIKGYLNISVDPVTFIQAALPQILENTKEDFFQKNINLLKDTSDICYQKLNEIDCINCPHKAEGSMFIMVKPNFGLLQDIKDDMDFCFKLAKEESVIVLPGFVVGLKNWLRITFAIDPYSLEDALGRMRAFCQRHSKV